MNKTPSFGVCLFDRNVSGTQEATGYFSIRGEPAQRFKDPSDLDSSVYWISSVGATDDHSKIVGRRNFKPEDYLSISPRQMGYDLGLSDQVSSKEEVLPLLSLIVDKTMSKAWQVYPFLKIDSEFNLRQALTNQLFGREFPKLDGFTPDFKSFVENATQRTTQSGTGARSASNRFCIRKNMVLHAFDVLDTPVPTGAWSFNEGSFFGEGAVAVKNLLSMNRFFLARVKVMSGNDSLLSPLVSFGRYSGPSYGKSSGQPLRSFVSNYELAVLNEFFEVQIEDVRYAESSAPLPAEYRLPDSFVTDPFSKFCYSNQLLSQIHLGASLDALRIWNRGGKTVTHTSLLNMVLVSRDRALTFLMAADLAKAGFSVASYRQGYAYVDCFGEDCERLSDLIDEQGWAFPTRGNLKRYQTDANSKLALA